MDISQFLLPSGLLDLTRVRVNPALILKAPRTLLFRRLFLPVCVIDGEALVACGDVNDAAGLQALESALGVPLVAQAADRDAIRRELRLVLGDNQSTQTSDDPVIMVESILRAAALREASDVHLDPFRTEMRVRIRVDGILEDFISIPAEAIPAVISRIKVLAGLDIAERRAPQDGAFVWRHREHAADIRVATLPVRFGERVTMRLLKSGEEGLALETLGLSAPHLDAVRGILARPHGLVLLTGPTGSGKTTTLYAAIRHLLAQSRALNILTVEDPVEYEIPGIAQTEVDSADKVNFSKALRSLLRHDPDVIMIGEIRDETSLDTAVKAALTGHLVLSTLHTNDAISAPTRLADMGLAPHLIGATLRLSAAQRLVRKLCPHCRVPRAKKSPRLVAHSPAARRFREVRRHF